jgi:hypothetical protein
MNYKYEYNKQYQTLQQFDVNGVLRSSMSMPQVDLNKLASLNVKMNILRKVDVQSDHSTKGTTNG